MYINENKNKLLCYMFDKNIVLNACRTVREFLIIMEYYVKF